MCVMALLAICVGVLIGGIFEFGKAISNLSVKHDKLEPVLSLELPER